MLTHIENLVPRSFDAASDETIETVLARCYRIARERARQMQLAETRARDEREAKRRKLLPNTERIHVAPKPKRATKQAAASHAAE